MQLLPTESSVAGDWGVERRSQLLASSGGVGNTNSRNLQSTCRTEFDGTRFVRMQAEHDKDPMARYRKHRAENAMLLTFKKETPRHTDAFTTYSSVRGEAPAPKMTTTSRSMNEWIEEASPSKMHRTRALMLRTSDAPIAVGRSGARVERGAASTEGLIGERLCLSSEPSKNSFVQRSWMYQSDKALLLRMNGVPVAPPAEGMSLPGLGDVDGKGVVPVGWHHSRKAVLTGDVLTHTGGERAGIFLDDGDYGLAGQY
jgi:hypothetical protein